MQQAKTAGIRGARTATITFAEPIPVAAGRGERRAAATLIGILEQRFQSLLDERGG